MLERGGLVGFDEHLSLIVWKSPVRKSSEKNSFWGNMEGSHPPAAREKQTKKCSGLINEEPWEGCMVAQGEPAFPPLLLARFLAARFFRQLK